MCIQEVHGEQAILSKYLDRYHNSISYYYSEGPDSATGGLLIIVRMNLIRLCNSPPSFTAVQAGRAAFLELSFFFGPAVVSKRNSAPTAR